MPNNVKITTIFHPLDLLIPHSCRGCGSIGTPLCDCCKNYILKHHTNFCPVCKAKIINGKCHHCKNFPPSFIVSARTGLVDQLIHELKYSSCRALAKPLSEILNHILPSFNSPVVIIPLPTTSQHIRERGLDHTKLIAKNLAKIRRNWRVQNILLRQKNTVQVGSNRKTRLTQAEHAYAINKKIRINPDTTYLLFDDVWTTGASMRSAIKKLRQAGAKKIVIALLAVS